MCLFQSMIQIKERKEMEDAFKKAQKPWSKLLQKVNKAKADYHSACKQEKSASNQERNATGDSSFSMDQVQARTFWLMLILSGVLLNFLKPYHCRKPMPIFLFMSVSRKKRPQNY